MKEIQVWDLQTRIFHWSLTLFMLCAFVTSDILRRFGIDLVNKDVWLAFHIGIGVAVAMLLTFRIIWGFWGPRYSRFDSLRLAPKELSHYFGSVFKKEWTRHTGHNPAASWSTVCMIVLGLLITVSGVVVFGLDEGRGIFRFLYFSFHPFAGAMKWIHLGLSFTLLAVIAGHVAGVVFESMHHQSRIITAMITGRKPSNETDVNPVQGVPLTMLSFVWVISPVFAVLFFMRSLGTEQPPRWVIPATYRKECAACHMAFPPNALPAKSWENLLANLQDHFGEDASINDAAKQEIQAFLVGNAAERSLEEASIKFIGSIGKGDPPRRITEIPYWKEKHHRLGPEIYQRETVKSRLNCIACHKWSEYGSFEDSDIRIPKS